MIEAHHVSSRVTQYVGYFSKILNMGIHFHIGASLVSRSPADVAGSQCCLLSTIGEKNKFIFVRV